VDTTIRNLDDEAYRALKAWAALHDKSIGEAMSDMIRSQVGHPQPWFRAGSILDLPPVDFGKGTERLSEDVDEIAYGA
jgi:plasmid stability protein